MDSQCDNVCLAMPGDAIPNEAVLDGLEMIHFRKDSPVSGLPGKPNFI